MEQVAEMSRPARPRQERTCAGCKSKAQRGGLVRLVYVDQAPFVVPDVQGRLAGRGAWVHPQRACVLAAAHKGGLSWAFGRPVVIPSDELCAHIVAQFERRIEGLVASTMRTRNAVVGTDAVREALNEGKGALLILARDGANRKQGLLKEAVDKGIRVTEWQDKARLGALFGRDELGVILILEEGLAMALDHAIRCALALSEDA